MALGALGDILSAPFKALGTAASYLHNPDYKDEQAALTTALSQFRQGTPDQNGIVWDDTITPQQKQQNALLALAQADSRFVPLAIQAQQPTSPLEELEMQLKRAQIANTEAEARRKGRIADIFSNRQTIGPTQTGAMSLPADPNAPLSVRNNNPGNIRGFDGNFRKFNSPDEGLQAMASDLAAKITGNSRIMKGRYGEGYTPTLQNVIETWAPPSENDTGNYVNFVAEKTGIDPTAPITTDNIPAIQAAMIEMEGGPQAADAFSVAPTTPSKNPALEQLKQLAEVDPETYGGDYLAALAKEKTGPDTKGEMDLRKEFTANTKEFKDVQSAYKRISKSQDNAAGDIALIFNYMKMLDPGSTVREGEFATAQNAAGVPTQILNLYNKTKDGTRLAPEQRAQFKGQARDLYGAARSTFDETATEFENLAQQYGYDPERIVSRPAEPEEPKQAVVNGWKIEQVD